MGWGAGGLQPPPPKKKKKKKLGQLRFFGQQEKFGQTQLLKKFACVCVCVCVCVLFFYFEERYFLF